ncbi:MAG: hypothetical protein LQ352_007291 [Teloschistes flavicans]|nr:MAG: hypothetical protein LQ352_007291 [Teloschistes flavicans]
MSSGFVSGGTTDHPVDRDDEWLKAQQEIEATRRRKEEEGKQEGGKSLYEVLQNNKAAKQEAFEESIRLRNQFRNLDEDEVEFLDSVLESTRAKEAAVKKETSEQLRRFRRQQEEADKEVVEETANGKVVSPEAETATSNAEPQWAINARKRKRAKDSEILPGLKLRKASSASETQPVDLHKTPGDTVGKKVIFPPQPPLSKKHVAVTLPARQDGAVESTEKLSSLSPTGSKVGTLGLAAYSSDEED